MKTHFYRYGSLYLTVLLLLGLVASYYLFPGFRAFADEGWEVMWSKDRERITAWFANFGWWGPLFIILFMVLQMFLMVFPTWLPMIVAILGYGPYKGVLISLTAVLVASVVGYYLGEQLAKPLRKRLLGEKRFQKLSNFMQAYGFWAIVLFRVSPFLSNDAISFVAGAMKMGFRKYLLATLVGIFPLVCAIGYFGKDTATLKDGLYWISGAGVILYLVYLYWRHRKDKLLAKSS